MKTAYTIGIIVFDAVLTSEVTGPAEVFGIAREYDWFAGSRVLLIGVEQQPTITTQEGLTLTVDATITDAPALDVLIVPGANDVTHLLENATLNQFIRDQQQRAEWVGSVCAGAFLLGNAGVLDGKRATTWFGGEQTLQEQFPAVSVVFDNPVVVDNRLVTANGGLSGYQAALVLLAELTSSEQAHEVYQHIGMDRLQPWAGLAARVNQTGSL